MTPFDTKMNNIQALKREIDEKIHNTIHETKEISKDMAFIKECKGEIYIIFAFKAYPEWLLNNMKFVYAFWIS